MKDYLTKITGYNLWANKRLGKTVLSLTDEQLQRELISSFPTIKKTILHIWDAETIWLKRLQGESLNHWPSESFDPQSSKEDLVMQWLHRSNEFHEFLSNMGVAYFQRVISYSDLKGNSHNTLCPDIIIHCMNHSTFHRGQVVTMLRNLNITELPSTDYSRFVREEL